MTSPVHPISYAANVYFWIRRADEKKTDVITCVVRADHELNLAGMRHHRLKGEAQRLQTVLGLVRICRERPLHLARRSARLPQRGAPPSRPAQPIPRPTNRQPVSPLHRQPSLNWSNGTPSTINEGETRLQQTLF